MNNITVDFETLKFNLYEILGLEQNASDTKIKKAFRNLVLNFHPDKNNNIEEDIYYHIITANQILSNKEYRQKYDEYISKNQYTHDELKKNFNKNSNICSTNKDSAESEFNNKFKELDDKHFISYENKTIDKTLSEYDKMLKENIDENILKNYIKN